MAYEPAPDRRQPRPQPGGEPVSDLKIALPDETATRALGAALAGVLRRKDVVALVGALGTGKTTLARALIAAAAGVNEAASPTYSIVETYRARAFDIWHYDLYRLEKPADIWEAGFEDALEDVALIEWPERIEALLPETLIIVSLAHSGAGRAATIRGYEAARDRIEKADLANAGGMIHAQNDRKSF